MPDHSRAVAESLEHESQTVRMLRAVRLKYGYTQAQLARQLNVSRRTVLRWEHGYEPPTYLCAALRELLAGDTLSHAIAVLNSTL